MSKRINALLGFLSEFGTKEITIYSLWFLPQDRKNPELICQAQSEHFLWQKAQEWWAEKFEGDPPLGEEQEWVQGSTSKAPKAVKILAGEEGTRIFWCEDLRDPDGWCLYIKESQLNIQNPEGP